MDSLLRRVAADGGGMGGIAARALAAWTDVGAALVPIIGQRGMAALYARALHLAGMRHGWLRQVAVTSGDAIDFPALAQAMSPQAVDDAISGIVDLSETFEHLLGTLIGGSLTERLLQPLRDDPTDPPRQDPPA